VYNENDAAQIVALSFETEITAGEPSLSDETSDWGYFSLAEMEKLDMLLNHETRIQDAFDGQVAAFIK